MKPLTIEQLKALEIGDWVWISAKQPNRAVYIQKDTKSEKRFNQLSWDLSYSDYGTKWLAYKNKEQAEANGDIFEFPCGLGDTVYIVSFEFMDGFVEDRIEYTSGWIKDKKIIKNEIDLCRFMISYKEGYGFLTEEEADIYMKERQGDFNSEI